jgi:outer membrane protein assembly factor BamD
MQLNFHINWFFIRIIRSLVLVVMLISSAGCGNNDEIRSEIDNYVEAYETAQKAIEDYDYPKAIRIFEAIQARFPFSELSRQIQLELLHAYYKSDQRELAVETADNFIRENPIHERVDYALYIKGLSYFEDETKFLEEKFKRDLTKRPTGEMDLAYSSFLRLVERFPDSKYSADAHQRIIAIKERMSFYENHVADYYLRRGAYVASINRAKSALEKYNGTSGNAESLRILIDAYDALGLNVLRDDVKQVLRENFPDDDLPKNEESEKGFLEKIKNNFSF